MFELIVLYLIGLFSGAAFMRLYLETTFRRAEHATRQAEKNLQESHQLLKQLQETLDHAEALADGSEVIKMIREKLKEES